MRKHPSPVLTLAVTILLILSLALPCLAGITFNPGQGVVMTGADGVVMTGADGVVMTGADGFSLTGVQGVVMTGADAFTYTDPEGVVMTGADQAGLQGFDPELAMLLSNLPDTSAINVAVIYHNLPTSQDLDFLSQKGVIGGTVYRNL